jgi:DNA-binding transcriptional ArsR family regulator
MNDIPDYYALETVEQLRVVADVLRQRICDALASRAMTITQLGDLLDIPPAKVLYHIRELMKVGLVELVETREKGGALEKYYRVIAEVFTVPPGLISSLSSSEDLDTAQRLIADVAEGLAAAVTLRRDSPPGQKPKLSLSRMFLWMTDDEVERAMIDIHRLLEPFELRNATDGATERAVVLGFYNPRSVSPDPGSKGRIQRTLDVGVTVYDRAALERIVRSGDSLDLTAVGEVTFTEDVTPELIDAAITRFRLKGALFAGAAVKEALAAKDM